MFTGHGALRAVFFILLSVLAVMPIACGGNAIENENDTTAEPSEPGTGGEEPTTEIDEEGPAPIEPNIEPSGEGSSPVDVNGGDVGGGGSSD